jgi:hypothetical protein
MVAQRGSRLRSLSRGRLISASALWLGALGCVASLVTAPAARAADCGTGTATLESTGGEQCYAVPDGVTEVHVVAVGGHGGAAGSPNFAFGAAVSGDLPVSGGQTLFVEVGANGALVASFGGGGAGGLGSAAGGGASDVRTVSCGSPCDLTTPDSLDSRLLVAGGAGGTGASGTSNISGVTVNGGLGGAGAAGAAGAGGTGGAGDFSRSGNAGGGGGGGATASMAGQGGAGGHGDDVAGTDGASGTLGVGGAGSGGSGSGGGGGGFQGGGSGGTGGSDQLGNAGGSGGGGAGSSFTAPSVLNATFATDTTGVPEVQITPLPPALAFAPVAGLSFPGAQAEHTSSAPQTLTVTNLGTAPLRVSAVQISGSDQLDFAVESNGCVDPLAVQSSCTVTVTFTPGVVGARTATLEIASNSAGGATMVPLSGTGGPPIGPGGGQTPVGGGGPGGGQGPGGGSGPGAGQPPGAGQTPGGTQRPGAATGKLVLATCRTVTETVKRHGKRDRVKRLRCVTRHVAHPFKLKTTGRTVRRATVTRNRATYATGTSARSRGGRLRLLLHTRRRLRPGRYTLTLRSSRGHHRITLRKPLTIR